MIEHKEFSGKEKGGLLKFLFNISEMDARYRYSVVFGGGVVCGILLLLLLSPYINNVPIDDFGMRGTIFSNETDKDLKTADHVHFNSFGVSCEVDVKYFQDIITLKIHAASEHEIELIFNFDERSIKFSDFRRQNNNRNILDISEQGVKFSSQGTNRYLLVFKNRTSFITSPINFKIIEAGVVSFEETINTGENKY